MQKFYSFLFLLINAKDLKVTYESSLMNFISKDLKVTYESSTRIHRFVTF